MFRPIIALILLLLWGTATVHCGLELNGLFGAPVMPSAKSVGHHPMVPDNDPEGCGAIESGHFDSFVGSFVVVPPIACDCLICHAELPDLDLSAPLVDRSVLRSTSPPLELAPSWTFVRRAAPPSRAPALLA